MHLIWFRRDLRVSDNPALYHACLDQVSVIGLYICTPKTWACHHMSHAQQHWVHNNISLLKEELIKYGIPLYVVEKNTFIDSALCIQQIVKEYDVSKLFFNEEYGWDEIKRDCLVKEKLKKAGIGIATFHDACLCPPHQIKTKTGTPYTLFTPYKKKVLHTLLSDESHLKLYSIPRKRRAPNTAIPKIAYQPPALTQDLSWLMPGEKAANKELKYFIENRINRYDRDRDYLAIAGTSKLSPYLAIGVLSPKQCVNAILYHEEKDSLSSLLSLNGASCWISELIWRDFYKMICYCYPRVSRNKAFKPETDKLIWSKNEKHFIAWSQGQTGIPIIDSAMRQLNQTGWMHNRLRMLTAMYLTKNLWIDWRKGEAYFASQLVDWDFASNNGGWQWSASTGTDAAPYFRIFNPVTQSERFDPEGQFIREYCPELAHISTKSIHQPTDKICDECHYPRSMVDLKQSRADSIARFKQLK